MAYAAASRSPLPWGSGKGLDEPEPRTASAAPVGLLKRGERRPLAGQFRRLAETCKPRLDLPCTTKRLYARWARCGRSDIRTTKSESRNNSEGLKDRNSDRLREAALRAYRSQQGAAARPWATNSIGRADLRAGLPRRLGLGARRRIGEHRSLAGRFRRLAGTKSSPQRPLVAPRFQFAVPRSQRLAPCSTRRTPGPGDLLVEGRGRPVWQHTLHRDLVCPLAWQGKGPGEVELCRRGRAFECPVYPKRRWSRARW